MQRETLLRRHTDESTRGRQLAQTRKRETQARLRPHRRDPAATPRPPEAAGSPHSGPLQGTEPPRPRACALRGASAARDLGHAPGEAPQRRRPQREDSGAAREGRFGSGETKRGPTGESLPAEPLPRGCGRHQPRGTPRRRPLQPSPAGGVVTSGQRTYPGGARGSGWTRACFSPRPEARIRFRPQVPGRPGAQKAQGRGGSKSGGFRLHPPKCVRAARQRPGPENARGREGLGTGTESPRAPPSGSGARPGEASPPRANQARLERPGSAARPLSMVPAPARARKACRELPVWAVAGRLEAARGRGMSEGRAAPGSAASLEELRSWPEELCRRELPSVLPRLLISFPGSRPTEEEGEASRLRSGRGALAAGRAALLRSEPSLGAGGRRSRRGRGGRAGSGAPGARAGSRRWPPDGAEPAASPPFLVQLSPLRPARAVRADAFAGAARGAATRA